ncbi:polymerase/histidinol phosphatase-like protein [Sparassis latifolia]
MPYSHHSHSGQFCKHAAGTLEDVVLEAIKQGFEVYGLTEHVPRWRLKDLYPEEEGTSIKELAVQFDQFIAEAHRLKQLYADRITLLVGLETEFITKVDLDNLEKLLQRYRANIEYVVGSVHHIQEVPIDFSRETYEEAIAKFGGELDPSPSVPFIQMEVFLGEYFDGQYKIIERFRPEVIGHIDLCRLYNPTLKLEPYHLAWSKLQRNIRFAVSYGALFECNAAALRKVWDTCYPGEDVARLIMKEGGRFCLSDDSHGPHAVGLNYGRMANYLRRIGVSELWVLERSETANAGGRFVCPRKVEGQWWEHSFWQQTGVSLQ